MGDGIKNALLACGFLMLLFIIGFGYQAYSDSHDIPQIKAFCESQGFDYGTRVNTRYDVHNVMCWKGRVGTPFVLDIQ